MLMMWFLKSNKSFIIYIYIIVGAHKNGGGHSKLAYDATMSPLRGVQFARNQQFFRKVHGDGKIWNLRL